MKRPLAILVLVLGFLAFGCIWQPPVVSNNNSTTNNMQNTGSGPISPPGNNFSVYSYNDGGSWKFNLTDFSFTGNSNPFSDGADGNLGKGSTAYVRVNESDLSILTRYDYCGINESQSIWVTPMISKGKGVLFEAAYLADFNGIVGACKADTQKIMLFGEEWVVLEMKAPAQRESGKIIHGGSVKLIELHGRKTLMLTDGSGFDGDSRWPTVLGWQDGKLKKIIIYMGGYFYDIESEKSTVQLFGSGSRVFARFSNLDSTPKFDLFTMNLTNTTSNIKANASTISPSVQADPSTILCANKTSLLLEGFSGSSYTDQEVCENNNQYSAKFNGSDPYYGSHPGIPICTYPGGPEHFSCNNDVCSRVQTDYSNCSDYYRSDRHHFNISFMGENWILSKLSPPATVLADENSTVPGGMIKLSQYGFSGVVEYGVPFCHQGQCFRYDGSGFFTNDSVSIMIHAIDSDGTILGNVTIPEGSTVNYTFGGKAYPLYLSNYGECYAGFSCSWLDMSIRFDEITLEHGKTIQLINGTWNVSLEWTNLGAFENDTKPDHLRSISLRKVPTSQLVNQAFIIEDWASDRNYSAQFLSHNDSLLINFTPPLPEYTKPESKDDRIDAHRIFLNISGNDWVIAKLDNKSLILAKEKENAMMEPFGCYENTHVLNLSGKSIAFEDFSQNHANILIKFCEIQANGKCTNHFSVPEATTIIADNGYIHVWKVAPGYTFCAKWIHTSAFSEIIELDSTYLTFENTSGTALESITIPMGSTVYAKLTHS